MSKHDTIQEVIATLKKNHHSDSDSLTLVIRAIEMLANPPADTLSKPAKQGKSHEAQKGV